MIPFSYWILIFIVVLLSKSSQQNEIVSYGKNCYFVRKRCGFAGFITITLLMIFFSANTIANDVGNYRFFFEYSNFSDSISSYFSKGIGDNPLFHILQFFTKKYISSDSGVFQFVCACIIQTLFLLFYRRYSPSITMSLFMYIASGLFFFTCVSWKQSIAMGIGLTLVPFAVQRKWFIYYGGLLVAMLIHPYILMYGLLPLLINNKVWTKKNGIIVLSMATAGYALSSILGAALDFTEGVFGDRHNSNWFDSSTGVGLPRIIFFSITPFLSWIYRKRLDVKPYPLMNGFIQMSVISFGFYLMSLSGGANFISRMGTYFEPFIYVSLPYILYQIVPHYKRTLYTTIVVIMFLIFFSFLQLKRGSLF